MSVVRGAFQARDRVPVNASSSEEARTSRIVWLGFGLLLALVVLLLGIAVSELRKMEHRVDAVTQGGLERTALTQEMYQAARERSLLLVAIANDQDPFERDEHLQRYDSWGGSFFSARERLIKLGVDAAEQQLLSRQYQAVAKTMRLQQDVIDAAQHDRTEEAQRLLVREAIPAQETILSILAELSSRAMQAARAESLEARFSFERTRRVIWAGGVFMVLCGVGIAWWVRRRLLNLAGERTSLTRVLHETLRNLNFQKQAMDAHAIVSIADAAGNITYVNDKFLQISGYGREELIGKNHRLLKSGTQSQTLFEDMWSTISTGQVWHGEVCNRAKDGQLYWVNTSIVPFLDENGLPTHYVSVRTDITATKASEAALWKAKQELERRVAERTVELSDQLHFTTELMEALPNPMFYNNAKGYCLGVNRAWEDLFGVRREEIVGKTLDTLYPSAAEVTARHAAMDQSQRQNPGKQMYEMTIPTAKGEMRDVLFYKATFTNAQGRVGGLVGSIVDITERKLIEQQLIAAKQALEDDIAARVEAERALSQFKLTLDQSHDCVFMFAPDTLKFSYANRGAMDQVGYSFTELMTMSAFDIKPDYDEKQFRELLRPLMVGTHPAVTFETNHRHKDGHLIPVEVVLQYVSVEGAERFVGIVRDITERQRAEAELQARNRQLEEINRQLHTAQSQLLQSEKMASVGQLAAGVAHEINNPIGYVYSNLGTLDNYVQDLFSLVAMYEEIESVVTDAETLERLRAAKDKADLNFLRDDTRALMGETREGITRVKKIVQDLKDFSRIDASDEWHWADLQKGLDSTLNIVWNELKYKVEVKKEYADIPEVECRASQLNQVFMNLLVNAGHAIEEKGVITLRTGQEDEQVWVEIADSGKGIAPEHLTRIFDPFFTTKPIGQGTGLGLSLSYGIVQKHGGRIEVQSAPGKGTTFSVWLPIKQSA